MVLKVFPGWVVILSHDSTGTLASFVIMKKYDHLISEHSIESYAIIVACIHQKRLDKLFYLDWDLIGSERPSIHRYFVAQNKKYSLCIKGLLVPPPSIYISNDSSQIIFLTSSF